MTTMKNLAKLMLMSILTAGMIILTACSSEDDWLYNVQSAAGTQNAQCNRTVLVYLAGHNNLSDDLMKNVEQMKAGSNGIGNNTLLVFVRRSIAGERPWLARISNGHLTDSVSIDDMGVTASNNYACNPDLMGQVMHYAFTHYPAQEYGLVLGGHSTGWVMEREPNCTRGFGADNGEYIHSSDFRYINIPTLAEVLANGPHLKFIFADCCNFMCLESLYELRHTTDYIIGSPAEIPDCGAPYQEIVSAFFEKSTFHTSIIDKYYAAMKDRLPLSVVKTSAMDQLAYATRAAIDAVQYRIGNDFANTEGLIHYNYSSTNMTFHHEYNIFYDAGDFFRSQLPEAEYAQWKQALDQAVVETRYAEQWSTYMPWRYIYSDFKMTQEKYHGVSLFVPQDPCGEYGQQYYASYNEDIRHLEWYQAVGW